jgi:tetratricopeptide (TPR) repeat protein
LVGGAAVNPEAYEAYLMGRYHWNQRNEKALWKSIEYFQTALEKDPDYALAYVALAEAYIVLADLDFYPPSEAYPKGREFADKALEYDENVAEAHTALAYVKYMYDWDWPAAYVGFRRAIELTPNYATAHQWYAECLCAAGRYDEALGEIDRALELDPFSLIMLTMKADILYTAGRLGEALEEFQRVIEMDPDFVVAHGLLSLRYLCEGMYDDAVDEYTKFMRLMGVSEERLTELKRSYKTSGIVGLSRWQLERFERRSKEGYVNPIDITLAYATLDDMDRAFEWLERAREERASIMALITVDPRFDIMRSDPRFDALVERMELKL